MAGLAQSLSGERPTLEERLERVAWEGVEEQLDELGYATTGPLLSADECRGVAQMYGEAARFRSRIVMRRHAFGEGEYQYFAHPLPELVAGLRRLTYPHLAGIANRWQEALGRAPRYPATLDAYLEACHAAGQKRPTPLLLKYGPGDYNRLHQDLYGALNFPLQMAILLSAPGRDFEGGEFVLAEQRPRTQLRAEVVPLGQGEAVIFAVNFRPAQGTRGFYRLSMRHGVSRVRSGSRYTLGIIFHDAA
ncbi:MAG TPA: 2OG-Fe(II) oxygenase [Geminicoccaceae bacterium]|nr:2OG-Fe(II) oxygenase [Geminicoccaceae bacterium]